MTITIDKLGRRFYLRGDTYAFRTRVGEAGAIWDPEAKCWYTGRQAIADALVAELGGGAPTPAQSDRLTAASPIVGRAKRIEEPTEAQPLSSFELQRALHQLSKLTPTELSTVKAAVDEKMAQHLRTIGAVGDLTDEEWEMLDGGGLISCVHSVRTRTGLGLRDSKAYVDRARAKGSDASVIVGVPSKK